MKKFLLTLLITVVLLNTIIGCANNKVLDDKEYETYGLFNSHLRDKCVHYKVSITNIVWGVILIETIIMPLYIFGFSLYEPMHKIENCNKE